MVVRFGWLGSSSQLRSKETSEVAWGAHLAAEGGIQKAVPEIRKALVRLGEGDHVEFDQLGMALLDSLIRLGAKVPPGELGALLVEPLLAPAMVLMSRSPKQHESLLLEVLDCFSGEYWLAAGNLLTSIRSRRIAARLLEGLEVEVTVHLAEQDVECSTSVSIRCGGFGWTPSKFVVPGDYPPTPYYYLSLKNLTRAKLLAEGKKQVYFVRVLRKSHRYRIHSTYTLDQPKRKLQLIAQLLRTRVEALPFQLSVKRAMYWRDASTYVRKILLEHRIVEGTFRSLVNRLSYEKCCRKREVAHLAPIIQVSVVDHRSEELVSLPEIEGVEVTPLQELYEEEEEMEEVIEERVVVEGHKKKL